MTRRPAALILAMVVLLAAGCSSSDPQSAALETAVTTFVQTLERGAYDDAHALLCRDGQAATDAAALRTEFEPRQRPWKRKIWYTSRGDRSGEANLSLTPSGQDKREYALTLARGDGDWQVCDVSPGSWQVDPDY
jgi:hypothetical protein